MHIYIYRYIQSHRIPLESINRMVYFVVSNWKELQINTNAKTPSIATTPIHYPHTTSHVFSLASYDKPHNLSLSPHHNNILILTILQHIAENHDIDKPVSYNTSHLKQYRCFPSQQNTTKAKSLRVSILQYVENISLKEIVQ